MTTLEDMVLAAGVAGLAELYECGACDPVAVTGMYLDRIACRDGALGAMVAVDRDRAIADAAVSRARWRAGRPHSPIDGVPIAVKANIAVAGLPWSAGVAAYRDRIADEDADCVARLRVAGAVILGLTNMDEGALGARGDNPFLGRCHNPHAHGFSPGGSSGGSGAAVAAGLCAAALGTDTIGSVRIPAAYCGVFGHKPLQSLINQRGVVPLSPTFDHVGVLGRSADDCAALLGSFRLGLRHRDGADFGPVQGGRAQEYVNISRPIDAAMGQNRPAPKGLPSEAPWQRRSARPGNRPDLRAAPPHGASEGNHGASIQVGKTLGISADADRLRIAVLDLPGCAGIARATGPLADGAVPVRLTFDFARIGRLLLIVAEVEAAAVHGDRLRARPQGFSAGFARLLRWGAGEGQSRYAAALTEIAGAAHEAEVELAGYDALLLPATAQPAFAHDTPAPGDQADFMTLAIALGWSATVFPIGTDHGRGVGLPIGAQVIARDDATCLALARALSRPVDRRPPPAWPR